MIYYTKKMCAKIKYLRNHAATLMVLTCESLTGGIRKVFSLTVMFFSGTTQ